jgi:hypothetical protein
MLARERLTDLAKPTIAELETIYLTRLMEIDARIWAKHVMGTYVGGNDSKNQDEAAKQDQL